MLTSAFKCLSCSVEVNTFFSFWIMDNTKNVNLSMMTSACVLRGSHLSKFHHILPFIHVAAHDCSFDVYEIFINDKHHDFESTLEDFNLCTCVL